MGDWRRVKIVGEIRNYEDIDKLKRAVDCIAMHRMDEIDFGPLTVTSGICGLPMWPAQKFDCVGNLAERNYDEESVKEHLKKLGDVAESLICKVHVGDAYEGDKCVATVILDDEGCRVAEPEIETVPDIDQAQMQRNMFRGILGG